MLREGLLFYGFQFLSANIEINVRPCLCQGTADETAYAAHAEDKNFHDFTSEEIPNHVAGQVHAAPSGIAAGGGHGDEVPGVAVVFEEVVLPVLFIGFDAQGGQFPLDIIVQSAVALEDCFYRFSPPFRFAACRIGSDEVVYDIRPAGAFLMSFRADVSTSIRISCLSPG